MKTKNLILSAGFVLLSVLANAQAATENTVTTQATITVVSQRTVTESAISSNSAIAVTNTDEKSKEFMIVDKDELKVAGDKFVINKKFEPSEGKATWYGGRFHGRKTTSGEVYSKYKMTAAHRDIPFGTLIKVTNIANGEFVIVKVNDRCTAAPKKIIIDLSEVAYKKIASKKDDGHMRVKIERLEEYSDNK